MVDTESANYHSFSEYSIPQGCQDIQIAFEGAQYPHIIAGSVAAILSSGYGYRIPRDIDVWSDLRDGKVIEENMQALGYQQQIKRSGIFAPVTTYTMGETIIDLRPGTFSPQGLEYHLYLHTGNHSTPLPAYFFYPHSMIQPVKHTIKDATIYTLSREAAWLNLHFSRIMRGQSETEDSRHQIDIEILGRDLNPEILEQIFREQPGLYLLGQPLITFNSLQDLESLHQKTQKIRQFLINN